MMAKRRKRNRSGYYRQLFTDHPEWLTISSNAAVVEQWKRDHPGKEMDLREKQAMANVKSNMRSKVHHGKGRGRRLLKRVTAAGARTGNNTLVGLEMMIDDCLSLARQMDPAGLEEVIKNLRRARNDVVLKGGQG
jgi:hypothetical protein